MKILPLLRIVVLVSLAWGLAHARIASPLQPFTSRVQPSAGRAGIYSFEPGFPAGSGASENAAEVILAFTGSLPYMTRRYAAVIIEPGKARAVRGRDGAYIKIYIAAVIGECVAFVVDVPALGVSQTHLLNCEMCGDSLREDFYVVVDLPSGRSFEEDYSPGTMVDVIMKVTVPEDSPGMAGLMF